MQQLQRLGDVQNAVVRGKLIIGPVEGAFGAGAVVAANVDNDRVIEFALILNLLNDSTNLIVGIGCVTGKDLRLARGEFLLKEGERVPPRQLCACILRLPVRPRGELGIRDRKSTRLNSS